MRQQTTGAGSTHFVRDGEVLLEEWDAALGTVLRHYTGAPGEWGGLVSLAAGATDSRFFLFDQLGSTRGLLDELAALSDEFGYSAYGAELWATGASNEPLRYAGNWQYQRLLANKMNVGARVYDATTGVWLSIDPIGFDAGDFNLLRYTSNNPVNGVDPSGLVGPLVLAGCGIACGCAAGMVAACVQDAFRWAPGQRAGAFTRCMSDTFEGLPGWGKVAVGVCYAGCVACAVAAIKCAARTPKGQPKGKPPRPPRKRPPRKRPPRKPRPNDQRRKDCADALLCCEEWELKAPEDDIKIRRAECTVAFVLCRKTTGPMAFPDGTVVLPQGTAGGAVHCPNLN